MIAVTAAGTTDISAAMAGLPEALRGAVRRGLERANDLLERAVAAHAQTPFGSRAEGHGQLARSLTGAVSDDNGRQIGEVFLGPPADQYGIFVEVGTRPHFPPPAAIEAWVRRRLGVTSDREAQQVAFLIGRKISRRGTPGRFLFERALQENEERVVAILEQEVGKVVAGGE